MSLDGLSKPTTPAGRKLMADLAEEAERLLLPALTRYATEAAQLGRDGPEPIATMAILLMYVSTLSRAWGVEPAEALAGALGIVTGARPERARAVLEAAIKALGPPSAAPFGAPPARPS